MVVICAPALVTIRALALSNSPRISSGFFASVIFWAMSLSPRICACSLQIAMYCAMLAAVGVISMSCTIKS